MPAAQRPSPGRSLSKRPRVIRIPKTKAVAFHAKTRAMAAYKRQARGQLTTAKVQSPPAMAQNERVKPHKGHGYPVRLRKVQFLMGMLSHEIHSGRNSANPVTRATGKWGPAASQYDGGRIQENSRELLTSM